MGAGARNSRGVSVGGATEGSAVTKLLDGSVSTPGQLQRHMDPATLVLDPAVRLEGDA